MDEAQKPNQFDLQLLSGIQTVEIMSRLLGLALHKLGGHMVVDSDDELRALNGMALEHGMTPEGRFVVRLAVDAAEVERQATASN